MLGSNVQAKPLPDGCHPMNNPEYILKTLDSYLQEETELILYGRAALVLGYENSPTELSATLDVDAILPLVKMAQIEKNDQFWEALEITNKTLEPKGFYITHLFAEDQVILSPNWLSRIQPIKLELNYLKLFRPSTHDLILTKMMRVDPQDRSDIQFLLEQKETDRNHLFELIEQARVPDIFEIKQAFHINTEWLKKLSQS